MRRLPARWTLETQTRFHDFATVSSVVTASRRSDSDAGGVIRLRSASGSASRHAISHITLAEFDVVPRMPIFIPVDADTTALCLWLFQGVDVTAAQDHDVLRRGESDVLARQGAPIANSASWTDKASS